MPSSISVASSSPSSFVSSSGLTRAQVPIDAGSAKNEAPSFATMPPLPLEPSIDVLAVALDRGESPRRDRAA